MIYKIEGIVQTKFKKSFIIYSCRSKAVCLFSFVENKRRYFEECWLPKSYGSHWHLLYRQQAQWKSI